MKASLDKREKPRATPRPPPPSRLRPACRLSTRSSQRRSREASSVLCFFILSCFISRLHFLVLKEVHAHRHTQLWSPRRRHSGEVPATFRRQRHQTKPTSFSQGPALRQSHHGWHFARGAWHRLAAGRRAQPLTVAPYQLSATPSPHRPVSDAARCGSRRLGTQRGVAVCRHLSASPG